MSWDVVISTNYSTNKKINYTYMFLSASEYLLCEYFISINSRLKDEKFIQLTNFQTVNINEKIYFINEKDYFIPLIN